MAQPSAPMDLGEVLLAFGGTAAGRRAARNLLSHKLPFDVMPDRRNYSATSTLPR